MHKTVIQESKRATCTKTLWAFELLKKPIYNLDKVPNTLHLEIYLKKHIWLDSICVKHAKGFSI